MADQLADLHVGVSELRRKYGRIKGPVAFLDESYQAPRDSSQGQKIFYVLTAVLVEASSMEELRDGLKPLGVSTPVRPPRPSIIPSIIRSTTTQRDARVAPPQHP
ncbi:hypothetical protein [Mycobacteroides abscessus]|uniref:hypothetical protein n=1 Tax=Mycobacteroides abscessus TaxID=36809 RepID=UPI0009A738E5|nr:hypothetical protein [Mycobacteroides abscessus]MBN7314164.1 hypothetical protein [Mycobacteroides abscessus subsp. abscessus]SKG09366.1 Uncharacterised protein [Mycobacteroides abscessus subsp. massiliense]